MSIWQDDPFYRITDKYVHVGFRIKVKALLNSGIYIITLSEGETVYDQWPQTIVANINIDDILTIPQINLA